jgi:UDP-N-acetylglucosamine pyrophosphorylase
VNENNDKEIKFLLNNNVKMYCNNVSKFIKKKTENTEIIEYLKKI